METFGLKVAIELASSATGVMVISATSRYRCHNSVVVFESVITIGTEREED
jgi:hypothetical protein